MRSSQPSTATYRPFPFAEAPPILVAGLDKDPRAVREARAVLRPVLTSLQLTAETRQDVLTVVSELAANAITHAIGPYQLRLYADRVAIGCEVVDADPAPLAFPPQSPPADADAHSDATPTWDLTESGRGLAVVAALALGNCGCRASRASTFQDGKGVWCVLARS